jgi:hypothetical protein
MRKIRANPSHPQRQLGPNGSGNQKPGLIRVPVTKLTPSPENQQLYSDSDASLREFASHIRVDGILEPLVVTADYYVVSGHRRLAGAILAGLKSVPCRVLHFKRSELDTDRYIKLLREFNRQRSKSIDEIIRETVVDANPEAAYRSLVQSRQQQVNNGIGAFEIVGVQHRCEISDNKRPFLDAVMEVIHDRSDYWPLTDRGIHYPLLNDPPLRHAKKPTSRYANDRSSYRDLCDLLTRGRIAELIPWEAIADPTRPMRIWRTFPNVSHFVEHELQNLFGNYWRKLLQSQADHHEIFVEKNTALSVVERVATKFTITITSGRGQCCKERLYQMVQRFEAANKRRLILYLLSDFDPTGDAISNATARSLRDDFRLAEDRIVPVRVALRLDQVERFNLPRSLELKEKDVNRESFIARHGVDYAVELEAMEPDDLQDELDAAIRSYIDVDLFNAEVDREKEEAGKLQSIKAQILEFMRSGGLGK